MPNRPPTFRPRFAPPPRQDNRPTSTARGYDRDWQRLRLFHLRQHPLCCECEKVGRLTPATQVDHRVPVAVDPDRRLDPDNLRSLCASCHSVITQQFKATGRNEMPEGGRGVEFPKCEKVVDRTRVNKNDGQVFDYREGVAGRQVMAGGVSNPADERETRETPERTAANTL